MVEWETLEPGALVKARQDLYIYSISSCASSHSRAHEAPFGAFNSRAKLATGCTNATWSQVWLEDFPTVILL